MTKQQAKQIFIEEYYNGNISQAIHNDRVEVRCAWVDFTDYLCRNGDITQRQADTWVCPWPSVYK